MDHEDDVIIAKPASFGHLHELIKQRIRRSILTAKLIEVMGSDLEDIKLPPKYLPYYRFEEMIRSLVDNDDLRQYNVNILKHRD